MQKINMQLPDDFYERIKSQLYKRIGKELRFAHRVIDLGCGSCGLARFLTETNGQQVTGVDIYDVNFPGEDDHASYAQRDLRCIKADAAHLDFLAHGEVDAVITVWALHEMDQPIAVLREAQRVLRPDGGILIVDYPHDSLAQRLWNENYYGPQEVEQMLKEAGFDEVRSELIEKNQVIWARATRPGHKVESA